MESKEVIIQPSLAEDQDAFDVNIGDTIVLSSGIKLLAVADETETDSCGECDMVGVMDRVCRFMPCMSRCFHFQKL